MRFNLECRGTISAVEPRRVRVTWPQRWSGDSKHMERLPRQRVWYSKADAARVLRPAER